MNEQFDLFGNTIKDFPPPTKGRNKYKTMQEIYGVFNGKTCGNCVHCLRLTYHNKTYFKCELWKISNSEATDIRLKNTACKKYSEVEQ